ncbi:MAG TPA: NTP transferase domain-containing protein [Candidatus Omnitrophota bacterium]|nr:NTP transferase domain-containing protein [Candidatus Omnitrophota bacterium]
MKNVTAVILAAGMGTRMKSDVPKVLHRIGSTTMLERIMSNLQSSGIDDILAVIGYKAEMIESLFMEQLRFVRQPELLGSGDALAHAVDFMTDRENTVLVTCGDTPLITAETYKKMVRAHFKEKASCVLLTAEVENPSSYGRIVRDAQGNVMRIVEEKDLEGPEKRIKEINVGTYCFVKSEIVKYIREIELNEKKKEFYLTDIVDILRRKGKKIVSVSCAEGEHVGVNSRRDLAMVNSLMYLRKAEELMEEGVTIVDPATAYIDYSASIGRDTVIFPCTVIEEDVKVGKACKIGPFARLRPGTVLKDNTEAGNFVEICRTRVGKNTRVKHHTYLGDAVVGDNVNVGAGTITANYDGRNKNRTSIGDGAFLGVGSVLIAPVKIGEKAVVGAGSVVTRNKDVGKGKTVAGVPARELPKKRKKA